ncbi:MAG TPA: PIN domain-containing protein [Acidimicrobiales bacterium]|nr:PIN domain-containing protein [Acidimicrobiales bacterium]
MTTVLDSWSVLALLDGTEPAATEVEALLGRERPGISWINLGEVFYVVRRRHGEQAATETLRDLRPALEPLLPSVDLVLAAGRIKADHPLSYADAFAAATAIDRSATLWTGDPELLIDDAPWVWRDLR